jgi:hypothetical protein
VIVDDSSLLVYCGNSSINVLDYTMALVACTRRYVYVAHFSRCFQALFINMGLDTQFSQDIDRYKASKAGFRDF